MLGAIPASIGATAMPTIPSNPDDLRASVIERFRKVALALSEAFRVLKPRGRLQIADVMLEPHVTPEEVKTRGSWSD
jgi:ubiquinone/menaquinone biosynthesis C-methylase UbiE